MAIHVPQVLDNNVPVGEGTFNGKFDADFSTIYLEKVSVIYIKCIGSRAQIVVKIYLRLKQERKWETK